MGETRKKYTKEFELEAIRLLESGTKPGHEIERDLGIGSGQVYRWRKQFSEDGARAFPSNGKSRDEELAALRKEVKELREERDRNFEAAAADRVWVSDITYVATAEGWMYLCIVLDLYSRRVVVVVHEYHGEHRVGVGCGCHGGDSPPTAAKIGISFGSRGSVHQRAV
jgi:transposase-like protein